MSEEAARRLDVAMAALKRAREDLEAIVREELAEALAQPTDDRG